MSPAKHGQMIGTPWGSRDRQSSGTRLTSGVSKIKNALAKYGNRNRESRRRVDVTTTILLLIVHAVMASGTALAPFGAVDNDAAPTCTAPTRPGSVRHSASQYLPVACSSLRTSQWRCCGSDGANWLSSYR